MLRCDRNSSSTSNDLEFDLLARKWDPSSLRDDGLVVVLYVATEEREGKKGREEEGKKGKKGKKREGKGRREESRNSFSRNSFIGEGVPALHW